MIPAAPHRDPLAVIESMQAELCELRRTLVSPGSLSPADWALAAQHVQVITVTLSNRQRTVLRQEREACHA